jgi:tetratricopeptide (TPR) repeat protein
MHPYKRRIAMAFLFAITSHYSQAQSGDLLPKAEKLFEQEDYYDALPLFEELIFKGKDLENSNLKAGMCLLFLSKPEKGLELIRKAANSQNEANPYYQFWLGRAFHLNLKIDSALICYRKYLAVSSQNDEYRRGVEDLVGQIHRTEIHFLSSEKSHYVIQNLGDNINSLYTEHSPLVSPTGNLLVFTSRRPLFADEVPDPDGQYAAKLFYSRKDENGKWAKALPLHPRSGNKAQFASIQFLGKGDKLLLFSPEHNGTLWETEWDEKEFKSPVMMKTEIPARYFNPDGHFNDAVDKIAFSGNSIFDGTYDLYLTERKTEAKWSRPWKVGKPVNTPEDEIAPYWLQDGKTLIFASKGLKGLGGFDLYKTTYDARTKTFSDPENLGYPINAPGNDTHYFETGKGKTIFISSARANCLGGNDIYQLTPTEGAYSPTKAEDGW